ncbi:MAG: polysaccharide deacetylase family protein [Acidimicrobiales bacterium]|nr:polysaccharide deacetylase family protein [Acidimicrobiales bacterium]
MADGRSLALRTVKTVAAMGDRVRPPANGIVVLIYHRVGGGSGSEVDLDPRAFDEQMAWLAASGRALGLDAAVDLLAAANARHAAGVGTDVGGDRGDLAGVAPAAPDRDPIVVTFDDGTADLAEVATPILERHRVPATVYLATRFVDDGVAFPDGGLPLTWAAARDMAATGLVTFGSHTHGHLLLDRLPPAQAADELVRSRGLVEDNLGTPAHHFAYPKAVAASAAVEPLVRAHYRSAALGGNRPNPYGRTDLHRLARTAVQVSDGGGFFVRKARGGMALEDSIRRAVNRVRYRAAVG